MHLLAGDVQRIDDAEAAVDLEQPPGDIIFLSAADTEIAALAAVPRSAEALSIRFANLGRLSHPLSVDLYLEKTVGGARLVVVRAMGGVGYWPYGLDRLRALSRAGGPALIAIPGEATWDDGLEAYSSLPAEDCRLLWRYLVEGGQENARRAIAFCDHIAGAGARPAPPLTLPHAGCFAPGKGAVSLNEALATLPAGVPVATIVFYRALIHGGSTEPIDALCAALGDEGVAALSVFVTSLKDRESEAFLDEVFARAPPPIVLNTTSFAVSKIGAPEADGVLDRPSVPVLQAILAGSSEQAWRESSRGLLPRDLTMNVVMPEVDGRLLTRAISFKEGAGAAAVYRAEPGRVRFVAAQAAAWVRLRQTPASERRVALILSNYPDRDGRIANGVGLDTPASAVRIAAAMVDAGYDLPGFPAESEALMARLLAGVTNANAAGEGQTLSLADYRAFFDALPEENRIAVAERWGRPEDDPFFAGEAFRLALHRFGNVVVGIQPQRGYSIDPKATYHDPELVPPHRYLAFHAWLRRSFDAHAIVHVGKHGNLEWLPGKALGLSETCWPEIALGPVPMIYPFIVNDPGEGSQAKRRASAVVVDHLMPAMTRAEIHGPLAELETLIDEYYLAAGVDRRRRAYLANEILALAERHNLDRDLGFRRDDPAGTLTALDAHICELKEMQIRDGLHTLGLSPVERLRTDTLVAIARVPRSGGRVADASLHRAIADDLDLAFDPLDCEPANEWSGPRPEMLAAVSDAPWRSAGDTVERIELLATRLIADGAEPPGERTRAVLEWVAADLAPKLDASGERELQSVLRALDGRFVSPGPSGAPTRGRPDVLPTGRNFYSVDVRAVPTAAAWALGRAAADALALRHFQDNGEWPRAIAMSAWGTSNMRTGGDDIAQVLALIGAKPGWETGTGRVTGFRVLSLSELKRPRIDVTLKVSGMFRDAFPGQIDLIDSAVRAIAALDEDDAANPIAAAARDAERRLAARGVSLDAAQRVAATRIFGAKPGAYGAGLQAPIDTGSWDNRADLAAAFMAWGSFAYGGGAQGEMDEAAFAERLKASEAVFQAQDNREHDILDSDDYYQFQGGLAAAVEAHRGAAVPVYHGDHSLPEKPVVRTLGEEIARVVRGRAANPKWIAGMMRHGYKGAFEMAATVDYLFAYAATTQAVQNHHFDQLFDAYIGDAAVRRFIENHNRPALSEMAARLREAIDRGLWSPKLNSVYDRLGAIITEPSEAAE